MAEVIDDRYIINRGLTRIGSARISSLTEDTSLCQQARGVYYDRVDAILGMHDWSFAGKTFRLSQLAEVSDYGFDLASNKFNNGWRYAFDLPGERIGSTPRRVLVDPRRPDDPFRDYAIEEGRLFADRTPLWALVTVRATPASWSAPMRLAVIVAVAADLAVPITHDTKLAAELKMEAEGAPEMQGRGGLIGNAIAKDMAGNPNKARLWRDPLTEARLT